MSLDTLIAAAREGADDASRADRGRVRAKLAARLAKGDGAADAPRRALGVLRPRMTARLLLAAAVLVVGTASALAGRHVVLERARAARELAEQTDRAAASSARPVATAPSGATTLAPPPAVDPVTPPPPRGATRHASAAPASPSARTLDAEMALLQEAREALRRGDPPAALTALGRYDESFRTGALRPEAAALRVFALCDAGRGDEARARGAAFVKQWPRSPLTVRVRASCAGGRDPLP